MADKNPFRHQHFYYVFCNRPRRLLDSIEDPICLDTVELSKRFFTRVYNASICTYVCQHEEVTPAHKAVISIKEKVSTVAEIFENVSTHTPKNIFEATDFDFVISGKLVPLGALLKITATEVDPHKMCEIAKGIAESVDEEPSRNGIMRQIIQRKLGDDFIVAKTPMTKRQGNHFSPYSRSHHDLCIQHKKNYFKSETIQAAVISPSLIVTEDHDDGLDEGQVITSIMEFKTGFFSRDQTLAEMMCILTDCSVQVLKEGKQISKAVVYGRSVDYDTVKAAIYKTVVNFTDSSFQVSTVVDKLALDYSLNLISNALAN